MPDERVRAAVRNWASRLIANGVDYNDFVRTTSGIERWDQWLEAWSATAARHASQADQALGRGHRRSAGESRLREAVCWHFSKFVWVLDRELHRRNTEAAVRALYAGHALLGTGLERVEADVVVGNLRLPAGEAPFPLVVLIPGLDSTKEEFFLWESVFLERGMATLSIDGPGQGETGLRLPIRPDYEVAVGAVLDAVAGRAEIDGSRIGAAGVSLGGHYVVRAAAFEPRIRALASISGPYDLSAGWDGMPSLTREAIAHHTGARGEADARRRAGELSLAGVASRVAQPCLVVSGRLDRVIAWEETRRIAEEARRSEWVLYDEGTHVCNNIPYRYRPLVADWLRDRLAA